MSELDKTAAGQDTGDSKIARTRNRLVTAIREDVMSTGTFTAESVSELAGISQATFYNHFPNKEAALLAAYEALMSEVLVLVRHYCRIEHLLDIGLAALAAEWILASSSFFKRHARLFRLAGGAIDRSKAMRDVFRAHETEVINIYVRFIELGQAASVIRSGDAHAMAEWLTVTSESWNHSLVQKLEADGDLHHELTTSLVRALAPEAK